MCSKQVSQDDGTTLFLVGIAAALFLSALGIALLSCMMGDRLEALLNNDAVAMTIVGIATLAMIWWGVVCSRMRR